MAAAPAVLSARNSSFAESPIKAPAAALFYDEAPPARRQSGVDLLYITDRAPSPAAEDGAPYGEVRARRLMFGSAAVRLEPAMGWEQLRRHSLADPRAVTIGMALGAVREMGR